MAGHLGNDRGIISGINVTPLVDVTLVLLIIFIVTAKIVVAPAIPMDLPSATQGEGIQVVFSVVLPVNGPILVDGTPMADEAILIKKARDALAENPELRAVIQADGNVPHRRVIAVLDALRSAGMTRIAFAASPKVAPETEASRL